jgi:uncharacterized OB-fold protein/acyl dehydratase
LSTEDSSAKPLGGGLAGEELMKALEAFVGTADGPVGTCPYPVNEPMIHHWCDAIGDRNPSYVNPEFASASSKAGVIAPPTMLQAWTMRGLRPGTPEEGAYAERILTAKSPMQLLDEAGFTSVVATNCEQEYFRDLRPGDQISHTIEVESISPEKKTGLGVGHFLTTLYSYRDADGEVVGTMRFRILKFRPPSPTQDSGETEEKGDAEKGPIVGPRIPGGRPRPSLNQDVAFFWEGVANAQLLVQRCDDCQSLRHPPGPGCPTCSSRRWTAESMSGRGEIYSFVRHHHPNIPPFEAGHPVVLVELEEGVRIVSELVDANADIRIGQRVEVQFDTVEQSLTLPRFRIVSDERAMSPTD